MLTDKQELFVRKIIEGESQADAYRAAYSTQRMSNKSVWEKASRLMADDKVRARVAELRDKIAEKSVMSAQRRLEWLTELVEDTEQMTNDKLKAIDIMNKMTGEYVQKVEANVSSEVNICIELSDE